MSKLGELVKHYYEVNQQKKKIAELVDADNKEIKGIMLSLGKEVEEIEGYRVCCKVIEQEDFDQAKLLERIKNLWHEQNGDTPCPWVQTIEVVNMEAVTDAIYDGMINGEDLAACKTKKTQTRLTVNPIK